MENLLPLLVVLACPLMMIFMMKGMHGGHSAPTRVPDERDRRIADLEKQVAELREESAKRSNADGSRWTR